VLHPCSHVIWETSQEVTHPKIAPQQARLITVLWEASSRTRRCTFGDISNYSNPFMPTQGVTFTPIWRTQRPYYALQTDNLQDLLIGGPHPSIFTLLDDCSGLSRLLLQLTVMGRLWYHLWCPTPFSSRGQLPWTTSRLSTNPTNYHELFLRTLSLLTLHLGNLPGGHPS